MRPATRPAAVRTSAALAPAAGERFGALNRIGYAVLRAIARATVFPYLRLRREGGELPPGPCIIAPNHASYLDPLVVQGAISERRIVFLMTRTWYDRPLLRPFFRFMRAIPVDGEARNRDAMERAVAALAAGYSIGIFPEGAVSESGELREFRPGLASIAMRAGVPIVPVAVMGTRAALPKGARFLRPHAVTVRVGAAIHAPNVTEGEGRPRRQLNDELIRRVREAVSALLS